MLARPKLLRLVRRVLDAELHNDEMRSFSLDFSIDDAGRPSIMVSVDVDDEALPALLEREGEIACALSGVLTGAGEERCAHLSLRPTEGVR